VPNEREAELRASQPGQQANHGTVLPVGLKYIIYGNLYLHEGTSMPALRPWKPLAMCRTRLSLGHIYVCVYMLSIWRESCMKTKCIETSRKRLSAILIGDVSFGMKCFESWRDVLRVLLCLARSRTRRLHVRELQEILLLCTVL
jgi:hypothetical protein